MGEQYKQLDFNIMDTEDYVYKSHNLVESGYNFTLNEQRLTYLASKKLKPRYVKSNIKPSELKTLFAHETFKDLRIYVNEFKNEFNINSGNMYKVLEDTAKGLKKKEIHYLQDDGSFVEKNWVITSKYNKEGRYVELTFHPDLILDLLVLKRFSKMQYSSIKNFKNSYSFRIYELMQNGLYKGKREFEIEDFRYKLGIFDDNKYKNYNDLKKRVIKPSIESINEYTELNIEFKEYRKGRKVGSIEFIISQKSLNTLKHNEDIDIIDSSQIKNMEEIVGIKMTAGQVAELTDLAIKSIKENKIDMGFYDYIKYQMDNVKLYARNKSNFNWYGGIKSAIMNNWSNENNFLVLQSNQSFNNFESRQYDYDDLEKKLLGWEKPYEDNPTCLK